MRARADKPTGRPDCIYGNTRLRGRLPTLLARNELDALAGRPLPAILDALPAEPAVGAAADPVDEAAAIERISRWLQAELRLVGSLYSGAAAQIVAVLLARHDLADTIALLRGARAGAPPERRLAAVHAVGAIDQDAARDVAAAPDGAAAVTRLVARGLPDPTTARTLPQAWARFEVNEDPNELETAVATAALGEWLSVLDRYGASAAPVREFVQSEADRADVVIALGAPTGQPFRPLPSRKLRSAALHGSHQDVVIAAGAAYPRWVPALGRYSGGGDWLELATDLDHLIRAHALAGLRAGDPLSVAIPLGYVVAVEAHARNLRWLLQSHRRHLDIGAVLVSR